MNWLVVVTLVCAVALPMNGQSKTLVASARIPSTAVFDSVRSYALPAACDEQGRFYVRLQKPDEDVAGPLLSFSKTGVQEAAFDMSTAAGFNVFAIRPKGGIATVEAEQGYSVVSFGPDGKRESMTRLDGTNFFPSQLAVFSSGEVLLSGVQRGTRDSPDAYKAFTALYDSRGHLVKQLSLDEDNEIERAIEQGDTRYARGPKRGNKAVTLGLAVSADDDNVYLMRRTSPATVYVISPNGKVVRKLVVAPPNAGQMPEGMQVYKNKLALMFRDCTSTTCEGAPEFIVVDATTGHQLADYSSGDRLGGVFACYASDPERFFFLQMSEKHRIEIVEARPQ